MMLIQKNKNGLYYYYYKLWSFIIRYAGSKRQRGAYGTFAGVIVSIAVHIVEIHTHF